MAINATWHAKNRMPKGAQIDERIRWHVAHAKACACRPIPASVADAIRERRGRGAPDAPRAPIAKPSRKVSFTVKLSPPEVRGGIVAVVLAPDAHASLGGDRGRIPVAGTADGEPIRTSAVPMRGCHLFAFNKEMQAATGKGPGDTVRFVLRRDVEPRTIAPPRDLAAALRGSGAAKATWDALAYSHRKEYVRWIEAAKRPETRKRRVGETVSLLAAGKKWRAQAPPV